MFPASFSIPFGEFPSELRRDPTALSEPGPMAKLDLDPSSGCNFIAPVIKLEPKIKHTRTNRVRAVYPPTWVAQLLEHQAVEPPSLGGLAIANRPKTFAGKFVGSSSTSCRELTGSSPEECQKIHREFADTLSGARREFT
ncbi:hypothetical protein BHE74_00044593 [Ensete ventricosum]|nr:hypothetical protein BHE74_00044593 [Ensete ventricosum]